MLIRNLLKQNLYNLMRRYSTTPTNAVRKRIFSGIQPTGTVHLGNYFGAIRQWVNLQKDEDQIILSIVDLHSMTLRHNPNVLSSNILQLTATLLAAGLDPDKVILFQQSAVPQHTELFWYLSCISTMARLGHLPQFKEKSAELKNVPLGLFIYPVLQAADILTYKATHVPVGEDQLQHLQLTQELAKMINGRYKTKFPIPHAMLTRNSKIKSLRNPAKKMSKSDTDSKSCIYITDSKDEITEKMKKALTDFTSEVTYDPESRPGVSNLLLIHSAITGKDINEVVDEAKGISTGEFKLRVAEDLDFYIGPVREKYYRLLNNPEYLCDVLENGRKVVTPIAEETLIETREALGTRFNINQFKKETMKVNV